MTSAKCPSLRLTGLLLISALCVPAEDAPHRLAARAAGDTPLKSDLGELCDGIGGRPTGSPACSRAIAWAAKKFRDIGIQNVSVEQFTARRPWLPVSHFDFMISGVPNLVGIQDAGPYLSDYHAESDTLDRVNFNETKTTEAVAGVLLWSLAENPQRAARRQTRAEVEKLLDDTKLVDQMKVFGQWDDFKAGKRGLF